MLSAAVIEFFGSAMIYGTLRLRSVSLFGGSILQRWEYRYRHLRILMALALMTVVLHLV